MKEWKRKLELVTGVISLVFVVLGVISAFQWFDSAHRWSGLSTEWGKMVINPPDSTKRDYYSLQGQICYLAGNDAYLSGEVLLGWAVLWLLSARVAFLEYSRAKEPEVKGP
jgi:hypothetical protein